MFEIYAIPTIVAFFIPWTILGTITWRHWDAILKMIQGWRYNNLRYFIDMFRFYQGKNKLTQIALGKSEDNEYKTGLHKVANQMIGEVNSLYWPPKIVLTNSDWTIIHETKKRRSSRIFQ